MSSRPVYRPPAKPPAEPRVRKVYQAHLSVTCYLDVEVWAADEPEARLTAHDMTCPGKSTIATRMINESEMLLCTECAGNGFRLGTDWNVNTVEEMEKLRPHVPVAEGIGGLMVLRAYPPVGIRGRPSPGQMARRPASSLDDAALPGDQRVEGGEGAFLAGQGEDVAGGAFAGPVPGGRRVFVARLGGALVSRPDSHWFSRPREPGSRRARRRSQGQG